MISGEMAAAIDACDGLIVAGVCDAMDELCGKAASNHEDRIEEQSHDIAPCRVLEAAWPPDQRAAQDRWLRRQRRSRRHRALGTRTVVARDDAIGEIEDSAVVGDDDDGAVVRAGRSRNTAMTRRPVVESSAAVGSSARMTSGDPANARAIATRCFLPRRSDRPDTCRPCQRARPGPAARAPAPVLRGL